MFDASWYSTPTAPAVERRAPARREMKHELVAVVEEALAVDWLVVADREVALERGRDAGRVLLDGDRLDPVDGVLQVKVLARGLRDVHRRPGIRRLGAEIQEQRPLRLEAARRAAAVQASVQARYCWRGSVSSYDR